MQIVGLSSGGFLVEMSRREIKRVTGDNGHHFGSNTRRDDMCMVGHQFDLNDRFQRMNDMIDNREQLDKAIRQLRACADVLEPLAPSLVMPEPSETEVPEGD